MKNCSLVIYDNLTLTAKKRKGKHLLRKELLKSDSHLPKENCVICFIENPSKMMKNAFYFILKPPFV